MVSKSTKYKYTTPMKENTDYFQIDKKFIQAIDMILAYHIENKIKPTNDSAIAKLIYPANRNIISSVRGGHKHIPHLAIINMAKVFDLDMNYFYKQDVPFVYPVVKETSFKEDPLTSSLEASYSFSEKVAALIQNIDNDIAVDATQVITALQKDIGAMIGRLEVLFNSTLNDIRESRDYYKSELLVAKMTIRNLNQELKELQRM